MIAFPSIESLRHVVKSTQMYCSHKGVPLPKVEYVGTCKLHGSNASVRFTVDGQIIAQSRNRELSIGDDNFGFAAFVEKNKEGFDHLRAYLPQGEVVIYGEWCGRGIQDKVAISQLDRHFVAFSYLFEDKMTQIFRLHIELLRDLNTAGIFLITQIPTYHVTVDFSRPEESVEELTKLTYLVEDECPWAKLFGISGIGEGIVWAPTGDYPFNMWFKTKGLEHKKGEKADRKVEVAPEVIREKRELAEKLLPKWRLEQGINALREKGLDIDPKNIGEYLKWVCQDVLKEETDVIVASGLDWKAINPFVIQLARQYILEKCKL